MQSRACHHNTLLQVSTALHLFDEKCRSVAAVGYTSIELRVLGLSALIALAAVSIACNSYSLLEQISSVEDGIVSRIGNDARNDDGLEYNDSLRALLHALVSVLPVLTVMTVLTITNTAT